MEAPPLDLAIEDKLEGGVLDARRGPVDLIEEEDAGLGAGRVEPIGGSERGDPRRLDPLVVRDTDEIALGEEREPDVEEALPGALCDLGGNGGLADAVRATQEDR